MSFIVRSLIFNITLICALFVGLVSVEEANAKSFPILSSRHKFSTNQKNVKKQISKSKKSQASNSGLVLLTEGRNCIKKRPAGYELQRIVSQNIQKKVSAKSAIVMDAVTGETIYAHLPDRPGQPASTIKVLTGIIALDSLPKNGMVKVSRRAARMPRSKVYLRRGKQYPVNDLINAVLLASANDASVALAEKIGGSEKSFAKLMTAKAESFGATNTICKTASGLTARGQQSTARDLAKIFNMAMANKQFYQKMSHTKVRTKEGKVIRSHNKALWQVEGAEGGKTGYTNVARQTYVGKFKRGSSELVVALMGSETMWDDVKKLVRYGFAKKEFLSKTAKVAPDVQNAEADVKLVRLEDLSSLDRNNLLILSDLKKRPSL